MKGIYCAGCGSEIVKGISIASEQKKKIYCSKCMYGMYSPLVYGYEDSLK